jgi:L-iditol 2-dehydrogenase
MTKAAVLVEPRSIQVKDFGDAAPDDNTVVGKTDICGICGTDLHLYEGHMKFPYPVILGHEFTIIVEKLGKKASNLEALGREISPGDRLAVVPGTSRFCGSCFYCRFVPDRPQLCSNRRVLGVNMDCRDPPHLFGAFAERVAVDLLRWYAYRIGDDFPRELGALIEPMAVASRALERAFGPERPSSWDGFGHGKKVVVQGAGPIGLLVTAAASVSGAGKIIVIEKAASRLAMAKEMGADHLIDMNTFKTKEARINEVQRLTEGVGADVAIECVGLPPAFEEGLRMVRRGGRYVEVGHYTDSGQVEVSPNLICRGDIDISGSWSYPPTQFRTAIELLERHFDKIPFGKLVTHRFHFTDAAKAIEAIQSGAAVKVTLTP